MESPQRIRLTERDAIERGVHCPGCGHYAAFDDIIAIGECTQGSWRGGHCETRLTLELVVHPG